MDLNFASVIAQMGPDFAFRFINAARTPADYVLASFLPEEPRATYDAKGGAMTVRATMAGMVGMDSPYPPGGAVSGSSFSEQTAKIAQDIPLPEKLLRELHQLLNAMGNAASSDEVARNTILNFTAKVLTQAQQDTSEWMRGRALSTGKLQWTFNGIVLDVDYALPVANIFPQRIGAEGYGGSTSKWWADYKQGRALLKGQLRAAIAHPDTIEVITANAANRITLLSQDLVTGTAEFVRYEGDPSTGPRLASSDVRDRTRLIGYGAEGDVIDPANPSVAVAEPFFPRGIVALIGNPVSRGMTVGLGSALESESNPLRLGYTHLAPTTEAGGRPGRWAQVFTPENQPWSVRGRTASNQLPVIEAPDKIVLLSTEMP